jgi:hypothetical protein
MDFENYKLLRNDNGLCKPIYNITWNGTDIRLKVYSGYYTISQVFRALLYSGGTLLKFRSNLMPLSLCSRIIPLP